ncbi:glycosyltransferase [Rubidibacter lacunae KORDI 51-2]|uniref:Glycosyltransferase n=1 Tax=Rubidibacter lacunae KORDI 51-2 TaxID=582515 RepID=U5DGD8_9CHRO|nr:glycosyltransferase [Rubidibacter lacunae]ERN40347.1 glycosyltransferase [Rubidibacter lacunae KORDI 51-2]
MTLTLLFVTPYFPYPPDNGTRVDLWGRLQFFQRCGWRIVLAICQTANLAESQADLNQPLPLPLGPVNCFFIERAPRWSPRELPEAIARLQALIDRERPQAIWCEYADLARLAAGLDRRGAHLWFRPHNFEAAHKLDKSIATLRLSRRKGDLDAVGWPVAIGRALVNGIQTIRLVYPGERLMHRIADRLFFISEGDRRAMTQLYGNRVPNDWVIPFLERAPVPVKPEKDVLEVAYLGGVYTNNVNRAGALDLIERVAPAVEAAMPGRFRFNLLGRCAREQLPVPSAPNVNIHDFVEDLSGFLTGVDIMCVPVSYGWGCKLKVVEAIASGLPVVAAPEALRGFPPHPGVFWSCRTLADYVAAFRALLAPAERERTARQGRATYLQWREQGEAVLLAALEEAAGNRSAVKAQAP